MSRDMQLVGADNRYKATASLTALFTPVLVAGTVRVKSSNEGDTTDDQRPMCMPGKVEMGALAAWGECNAEECDYPPGTDYIDVAAGTHHNPAIGARGPAPCSTKVIMQYGTVGNPGNSGDAHRNAAGNTYPTDDRWNPDCDLSQDARIDMLGLRLLAGSWLAGHGP